MCQVSERVAGGLNSRNSSLAVHSVCVGGGWAAWVEQSRACSPSASHSFPHLRPSTPQDHIKVRICHQQSPPAAAAPLVAHHKGAIGTYAASTTRNKQNPVRKEQQQKDTDTHATKQHSSMSDNAYVHSMEYAIDDRRRAVQREVDVLAAQDKGSPTWSV